MSYLALARKWRPRTFSQLVGQDHINKVLIKSLNQQRVHHAYLFTGTRGVGKTSVARLMAKALNCEQGVSAQPCLQCEACLAIEQGRFIDLLEIDGASKTRVEDTRDLLENVQYAPTSGRYKIYLIDEVHMLSQHSFNALLKTLEEPPAHVKFLLATTDPQKLPITVLSRCLQFNLKHLEIDVISAHLEHILQEENHSFETEALLLLAKAAHGSMRDALSLLDQAIASSDQVLTASDIKTLLGYSHQNYALQLLNALVNLDATQLIKLCRQIAHEGGQFNYVLDELLESLHQITVCQNLPEGTLFDFSTEISALAKQLKTEDVQLFYHIGIKGLQEIQLAPTLLIGFEMVMLRMLTFKPADKVVTPPLAHQIQEKNSAGILPVAKKEPSVSFDSAKVERGEILHCIQDDVGVVQDDIGSVRDNVSIMPESVRNAQDDVRIVRDDLDSKCDMDWSKILQQIKLTGLAQNAAENAELISKSGREILLRIDKGHQSLFTSSVTQRIEQALAQHFGETIKILLSANEPVQASPAQKKRLIETSNQQEAEENLQKDPFLQELKQEFSAELVKNSIAPLQDPL